MRNQQFTAIEHALCVIWLPLSFVLLRLGGGGGGVGGGNTDARIAIRTAPMQNLSFSQTDDMRLSSK